MLEFVVVVGQVSKLHII